MKTLTDVEPRTVINATNTPGDANSVFRIAQAGSYYLASNVTVPSGRSGIEVVANDVTIDLNGFALMGQAGSLDGISFSGVLNGIAIRNGKVRGFGGDGIGGGPMPTDRAENSIVENVLSQNNLGDGITLSTRSIISRCTATNNGLSGIVAWEDSVISGCSASDNDQTGIVGVNGVVITDCTSDKNGWFGFHAALGSIVSRCRARDNTQYGIQAADFSTVQDSVCTQNDVAGIYVSEGFNRIEGNHLTSNATGILVNGSGNLLIRNSARSNGTNFNFGVGNTAGPIVNSANIATNNNPHANYAE
jgi:parallel beta-helix repeat protein